MTKRILRLPQVEEKTGKKRSTIYHDISEGRFPKPIKLGPRAVGWLEDEIDALIERRIGPNSAHRYWGHNRRIYLTPRLLPIAAVCREVYPAHQGGGNFRAASGVAVRPLSKLEKSGENVMKRQLLLSVICFLIGSTPALAENGKYVVLFPLGKATLDAAAQATILSAKQEYDRTGSAHITVVGHTDTSGSPAFNQALSERREKAVTAALIRLGVPESAITGSAFGESQPAVPTGPNVIEARNRRTEIDIVAPPPPAPAPEAPIAAAPPPPPPAPPEEKRWQLSAGAFYGYNFKDEHGSHSQLIGINLGLDYKVTNWMTIGIEQAGFYHFDTHGDGPGGRTVFGPDFYFGDLLREDLPVAPYIGGNIGYLYGSGIHDDGIAGPEIGMVWGMFDFKVAYDMPFSRNPDHGILNTTIGAVFHF